MVKRAKNTTEPRATVAPPNRQSQLFVALLLLCGIGVWCAIGPGHGLGRTRWILILIATVIAMLPPLSGAIDRALERIRHPSSQARAKAAILIGLAAAGYFILTAFNQNRDLFPKAHDDCSYAIGMQIMARGRLWMPALPIPDFFESFYILVQPAYCSKYFPGAALLFVPTVWLHLPTWVIPVLISGACVGLVYTIVMELTDGAAGALAALMMASLTWFRTFSILLFSSVPMLFFALLLFFFWLRWRKAHAVGWAALMGAMAGWGAITRPIDAIVVAIPIVIAIFFELVRDRAVRSNLRLWSATSAVAITGAAPFLALQIIFNVGVTGHALQTPYGYYIDRFQPNTTYGFHQLNPAATVQSTLPQKHDYYELFVRQFIEGHRLRNLAGAWGSRYLPMVVDTTMPCRLLLVFLFPGLLGLIDKRRIAFWSVLPLFIIFYVFSTFFLEHYGLLVAPAVIVGILLGGRAIVGAWPRWRLPLQSGFAAMVVMISLTSFWEINRLVVPREYMVNDETIVSPKLRLIHDNLADNVTVPAVVLFTYHPGGKDYVEEPVYNTDVAWPDDARIIHAHDLGPRNHEIFEYYARTQPDRTFYRFDYELLAKEKKDPLVRLGTAKELAHSR
ncbi:MAG TPA: glycosyltransferase family 39 protein [Humisphaera sp.]|jgi:hypothetical protein|nr:glycosyltransferase family 39 protein [Humisphaera sp.]